MNIAAELKTVSADEISAAFRAADLRRLRPGYGLATALTTPVVERALRLQAFASRSTQQAKQPAEVPA